LKCGFPWHIRPYGFRILVGEYIENLFIDNLNSGILLVKINIFQRFNKIFEILIYKRVNPTFSKSVKENSLIKIAK